MAGHDHRFTVRNTPQAPKFTLKFAGRYSSH
jgi:hypothetical protein